MTVSNQSGEQVISSTLNAEPMDSWVPNQRLYHAHGSHIAFWQLVGGITASIVIMVGLTYLWYGHVDGSHRLLSIVNGLLVYSVFVARGVYRQLDGILLGRRRQLAHGIWKLLKAWLIVVLLLFIFTSLMGVSKALSQQLLWYWAICGFIAQVFIYQVSYWLMLLKKSIMHTPIHSLVIGANPLAKQLVARANNNAWLADQIVGVIDASNDNDKPDWHEDVPLLGDLDKIDEIIKNRSIRRVYITLLFHDSVEVSQIVRKLSHLCVDIIWVPDIHHMTKLNYSMRELSGLPLLVLSGSPFRSKFASASKSVIDKVLALVMLTVLSPLMLFTALAIKVTSPGPVIFKQHRHGWDGRLINVYKFRSMHTKQPTEGKFTLAKINDPRVTRIGRIIRRTSIDELPQLFNVLNGSMSLVGPRPHAIQVNEFYSQHIPDLMLRHKIKPGITGLAQINGCRGGDDCSEQTLGLMENRIAYDIEYINNWTLYLDLKILLITPFTLFSGKAY